MKKALEGKRILVSRPKVQAEEFIKKIKREGAEPLLLSMIELRLKQDLSALYQQFEKLDEVDWIVFTSQNAVHFFFEAAHAYGLKMYFYPNLKIATVGEKTKSTLEQLGYRTNFVPIEYTAEVLAENMDEIKGKKILIPRSEKATDDYVKVFEARGAKVAAVTIYENIEVSYTKADLKTIFNVPVDYLTFTSGSGFTAFRKLQDKFELLCGDEQFIAIGPSTAKIMKEGGFQVNAIANPHTIEGMIEAMIKLENNV